jgi:4-amino-4-deoxy-L-arabinose transferase-like glycosyltransferase
VIRQRLLLGAVFVLAAARIASTYPVFNQTCDEPVHIAAGHEWLTTNGYQFDAQHPPLARAAFALWPLLTRAKASPRTHGANEIGNDTLFHDGRYIRNLSGSRAPNLIFLLIAMLAVHALGRHPMSGAREGNALVAVALFSFLPAILAHAGLATTDMAATAAVAVALWAFVMWLDSPTPARAIVLGVVTGLGLVTKFSFPGFFFLGAAALWLARPRSPRWRHLPAIAVIAFLVVWTFYKFDTGRVIDARLRDFPAGTPYAMAAQYSRQPGYEWMRGDLLKRYYDYGKITNGKPVDLVDWAKAAGYPSPLAGRHGNTMAGQPPLPPLSWPDRLLEPPRAAWQWMAMRVPLPAPIFILGVESLLIHNQSGQPSYFLGEYRDHGCWYYFPLLILYKTPIPFLLLWVTGFVILMRSPATRAFALLPLVMLIPPMLSGINIGVRHVLPLFPLMAIPAAVAVTSLWDAARARAVSRAGIAALLGWLVISNAIAHPDYLAYFNECAGRHPERIAADSNLDWGQDLLRLARYTKRQQLQPLYIAYFGSLAPSQLGIVSEPMPSDQRVHGWVAISEMQFLFGPPDGRGGGYRWLPPEPERRIGKSIRLYRLP